LPVSLGFEKLGSLNSIKNVTTIIITKIPKKFPPQPSLPKLQKEHRKTSFPNNVEVECKTIFLHRFHGALGFVEFDEDLAENR
jgi:hypothetical protein